MSLERRWEHNSPARWRLKGMGHGTSVRTLQQVDVQVLNAGIVLAEGAAAVQTLKLVHASWRRCRLSEQAATAVFTPTWMLRYWPPHTALQSPQYRTRLVGERPTQSVSGPANFACFTSFSHGLLLIPCHSAATARGTADTLLRTHFVRSQLAHCHVHFFDSVRFCLAEASAATLSHALCVQGAQQKPVCPFLVPVFSACAPRCCSRDGYCGVWPTCQLLPPFMPALYGAYTCAAQLYCRGAQTHKHCAHCSQTCLHFSKASAATLSLTCSQMRGPTEALHVLVR